MHKISCSSAKLFIEMKCLGVPHKGLCGICGQINSENFQDVVFGILLLLLVFLDDTVIHIQIK